MVKLNKIYTRTGDAGTTGLVDGSRRSKADARMHAIGEVDEANSALGIAIAALEHDGSDTDLIVGLRRIQAFSKLQRLVKKKEAPVPFYIVERRTTVGE